MPSSLIIVALAAAWLVVLVPMVARNRQEVARPADSALSARVVRSGNARNERRKEFVMAEYTPDRDVDVAQDRVDAVDDYRVDDYSVDGYTDDADADYADKDYRGADEYRAAEVYADDGFDDAAPEESDYPPQQDDVEPAAPPARPYRPGRGGFDPEAAEIAAQAKYTHRQRVVVALLGAVVVTAIVAAVLASVLWWLHAIVDVSLVGYLVYLRRQVRIENDIRERRTARLKRSGAPSVRGASDAPGRSGPEGVDGYDDGADGFVDEFADESDQYGETERDRVERAARSMRRPQRRPVAEPIQHNGVYVDLDDEDPEFHELAHPDEQPPLRRASGQ